VFKVNEGKIERGIRIGIGIMLLALSITALTGVLQWVAGAVSVVLMLTGGSGICPLYTLIGFITRKGQICPT